MSELIKVNYNGDKQTTSARDLWEFLGRPWTEFPKWFNQYKDYGFAEETDYRELRIKIRTSAGAEHDATDYEITIEMAKELCMLQKSEKGKIARQYFLELEKRWNSPEAVMARALKLADAKLLEFQNLVMELAPKAEAYDSFVSKENLYSISEVAKKLAVPNMGPNNLFAYLRRRKILCSSNGKWNEPYADYVNSGYFVLRDGKPWTDRYGNEHREKQTFVTPKGIDFIRRMLIKDGYIKQMSLVAL